MSTSVVQHLSALPMSAYAPSASRPSMSTVFDNGVEGELADMVVPWGVRRSVRRDDIALLDDVTHAIQLAPYVPRGCVVARVHDGVVTLQGKTAYYYERAAAECAVRFLEGVRSVDNQIQVDPPALAHEVRARIASTLTRAAAADATHIAVQAVGGTVILQGVVHARAERDAAARAAWSVDGVETVIDNLIVRD